MDEILEVRKIVHTLIDLAQTENKLGLTNEAKNSLHIARQLIMHTTRRFNINIIIAGDE